MKAFPIGSLTGKVATWNPATSGQIDEFSYIDLGSIDQKIKKIARTQRVQPDQAPSRARQLVRSGDVLVATVRPNLNGVALVPDELDGATASTGFCVLRPGPDLDAAYLFHWVRSPQFIAEMTRKATGQSYPAVSDRIVKESSIPTPPVAVQRWIAQVLDEVDQLRTKRREAITLLDGLVPSIFSNMFGNLSTGADHLPRKTLLEWVDSQRPITYGILKPGDDEPDGAPYVRVVDMKRGGIDTSAIRRTTHEISAQYKRSILKEGDILMSIRGHVGRLALVPKDLEGANITQDSARIAIPVESARYVMEYLRTYDVQNWMARRTKGAAVKGINLGDIKTLEIPVPPLDLQRRFSARAAEVDQLVSRECAHLAELDALFLSVQHRAFRGELQADRTPNV